MRKAKDFLDIRPKAQSIKEIKLYQNGKLLLFENS